MENGVWMQISIGSDHLAARKINQVGQHVTGSRAQQGGRRPGIDFAGDPMCIRRAVSQMFENRGLAAAPVRSKPRQPAGRIIDLSTVTGIEDAPVVGGQPVTGGHEIREIAVWRRNQRRRPAHDVVGGEAGIIPAQADMVTYMAGSMDHLQRPAVAGDPLVICQLRIGHEIQIDAFAPADGSGQLRHPR